MAARAGAQCPDGSPPPCKSGKTPLARPAPLKLNPKSWIVVPFSNATRAPDLEWLRDGSVNLLSLDLGRWNDIFVVPDQRVGDLLRELPPTRAAASLTLNDGLSVARRAGAGMLVMGDFYRVGKATRIVANVFDVRSGSRVRSVTQQAADQDSLLTAFAPLARGVLAVPPPVDARTGDVGTQRLDAYQEYLAGVRALNLFHLADARAHLSKAVALDSTFALAHYQLGRAYGWGDATSAANQSTAHALAAQRFGTSLPKRERALIDANVALESGDFQKTCELARPLVARDSSDVEALNMLGECSFHDDAVIPSAADSTVGTFRGNWNTGLRAFQRIIDLDPQFLGAFEHVFDIARAPQRAASVCPPGARDQTECTVWTSFVLRRADTLVTTPVISQLNADAFGAQKDEAARTKSRLANIEVAQASAQRWLEADPTSVEPHFALARLAIARGDLKTAQAELAFVPISTEGHGLEVMRAHLDVATKTGRGALARAILDSMIRVVPDAPGLEAPRGSMELAFGRMTRFRRGTAAAARRFGPAAVAYESILPLALLGLAPDSLPQVEAAFYDALIKNGCVRECAMTRMHPTLEYSLHTPAAAIDFSSFHFANMDPIRALAAGDTAKMRAAAVTFESESRGNIALGTDEFAWSLISAQAYLSLHDSASALRMTRFFVDTAMNSMPISSTWLRNFVPLSGAALWPRAMLLRADLAAAAGSRNEARTWYGRVLDLWADADPELQPTIARIRSAMARLGPPGD